MARFRRSTFWLFVLFPLADHLTAAVHLRTRTFSEADGLSPAAQGRLPAEHNLYLVAARGRIDSEFERRIERTGAEVVAYLPDQAFAVWASREVLTQLAGMPGIGFVAAIAPIDRIQPELLHLAPETAVIVEVLVVGPATLEVAVAEATALGLEVLGAGPGPRFQRFNARVPCDAASRLPEVAAIPGVFAITRRPSYRLLNDSSVWVHQGGPQSRGSTPIFDAGIHGEGQIAGILDTGLDIDSCHFRDPTGLPPINTGFGTVVDPSRRVVIAYDFLDPTESPSDPLAYDTHGHGTHVAGSIVGDNLAGPVTHDPGDGMAPAAKLVVQDAGFASDACSDHPALGCPVVDLTPFFDQAHAQGVRIHADPWGDQEIAFPQNNYTAACVDADEFMWTHPEFLLVFAAGNGGPGDDSVGSPSVAKNVVSVGGSRPGTAAEQIWASSSRGWAADGRIKPTVICTGSGVVSANGDGDIRTDNCSTTPVSGTTPSAGTCAGLALLARQYFNDGFYPSGRARPGEEMVPTGALVKAALVHSARNMTAETPIVSRVQGFGRVTLADTLAFRNGPARLFVADEAGRFPTGSSATQSYSVEVLSASAPLKVTLVWTDFPSNPLAARNLVNDLDLVVRGPSGTFLGNVFTGGVSTTGGTADRLNVEEEVIVVAPQPGSYTIEVTAFSVPQGPQGFALITSADSPSVPGVWYESAVVASDAIDPSCNDGDGLPDNGETVRLRITIGNPSASVTATAIEVTLQSLGPYATVTSANPVRLSPLAPRATASADFDLRILGAPCRATADFAVTATSAENSVPDPGSFTLSLEVDRLSGDRTLDFENGLVDSLGQVWTAAGGFATSTNRTNSGLTSLWAGVPPAPTHCNGSRSTEGANQCATLVSPALVPAAGATLTLSTWYQIQETTAGLFFDRANVHVLDGSVHTVVSPSAGRVYDVAAGQSAFLCHVSLEEGWAGTGGMSWAWSSFDLSPWAGKSIELEVSYNTDAREICEGIYLDDLTLANVGFDTCDALTCQPPCLVSALAPPRQLQGVKTAPSGITWSWTDGATDALEYHLNSVIAATDLTPTDPASPRLSPTGRGRLECIATSPTACLDGDGLTASPALIFHQVLAACGPTGADEGGI